METRLLTKIKPLTGSAHDKSLALGGFFPFLAIFFDWATTSGHEISKINNLA